MMHMSISLVIFLSFTMMLLTLVCRQQHLLPTLLCLEGLMLYVIYLLMLVSNNMLMMMNSFVVIILSMSVSSASIGLSLLVMTSRSNGNDSMFANSSFLC